MTLFDNLLTVFVLLVLAIIIYIKTTNRTLLDLFRDLRGIAEESKEEVSVYG